MPPVPDLVQVTKLDTQFHSDPQYTQHVKYVSDSSTQQRGVRKHEKWKREKLLGVGSYGSVMLERCIEGDKIDEVRAVKKIQNLEPRKCDRELEAIALFSYPKYEQYFVKSFGWYNHNESIFITMEYLPNGDLQKCLGSPLPEKEGQQIVFQILEGLKCMHDNEFAHRDLKPANILVVCKGPDWWVKIADFGISKRAGDGLTALKTRVGTPAFMAPEVRFSIQTEDTSKLSYSNAVDIWSLGVMTFLILTGETLFEDPCRLVEYVSGTFKFPLEALLSRKISTQGCDFVRNLMTTKPEDRPDAKSCLRHLWFKYITEVSEAQRDDDISQSSPKSLNYSLPEPSASWSTRDPILDHETEIPTDVLADKAISTANEKTEMPKSDPASPMYWFKQMTLRGHSQRINAVAISPNGKQIISASSDNTVRLWDSLTGAACETLQGHSAAIFAVNSSPDGKQIVSGSSDKTVKIWDSTSGVVCATLQGHSGCVNAVAFSPDGKQIASVSDDKTVRLWDSTSGASRGTLQGHSGIVNAVAFSPDGKHIASASDDMTARLWDSTSGAVHEVLQGHSGFVSGVAFSPDGMQIASTSTDKTIRIWNLTFMPSCRTLQGHTDWINAVAFSPGGKKFASASDDKTVRLWDSTSGASRGTLRGHSGCVNAVAFSPNGNQIASASTDWTVILWGSTNAAVQEYTGAQIIPGGIRARGQNFIRSLMEYGN